MTRSFSPLIIVILLMITLNDVVVIVMTNLHVVIVIINLLVIITIIIIIFVSPSSALSILKMQFTLPAIVLTSTSNFLSVTLFYVKYPPFLPHN